MKATNRARTERIEGIESRVINRRNCHKSMIKCTFIVRKRKKKKIEGVAKLSDLNNLQAR